VDKVTAEVHELASEGDPAKKYGVDKTPAIIILGDRDYGIRFYGGPGRPRIRNAARRYKGRGAARPETH